MYAYSKLHNHLHADLIFSHFTLFPWGFLKKINYHLSLTCYFSLKYNFMIYLIK